MAQFIKIYEDKPNEAAIAKVVKVLKDGGLVIYPTDTVYGLGCDITNTKALERIAKIKGIKLEKANFSFVCSDLSNISDYVRQIDTSTFKLLKEHFLVLILLFCQEIITFQRNSRRKLLLVFGFRIMQLLWKL